MNVYIRHFKLIVSFDQDILDSKLVGENVSDH